MEQEVTLNFKTGQVRSLLSGWPRPEFLPEERHGAWVLGDKAAIFKCLFSNKECIHVVQKVYVNVNGM